ncbi:MAG TPA: glycoside hydrolase family 97 protein [Povalibacter sp.]|uniref:glycoside hydrolase family 97 protein n=1 Tax=Povalibacter sp. TaxID=1962978 RepID=UPI002BFAF169|nr:glycoside hydrolase family 97 protein [Povalibacter sp.]HMN46607.1 glycoside hydrolase family 97 protein [Povalibacter sp.]
MKRATRAVFALLATAGVSQVVAAECVDSPGNVLQVCVFAENGGAYYEVTRKGHPVLQRAALGLAFEGEKAPRVVVAGTAQRASRDSTWEQPWGEERHIRDRHNEMRVSLRGDTQNTSAFDVVVRAFDDGFGFRYDFMGIPAGRAVAIADELTEFKPVGAYDAWWFQAYEKERDEYLYQRTPLDRITKAETPLTLESSQLYLSIHEAALIDYASMTLERTAPGTLKADLMPWSDGIKVRRTGPFQTPWRTVLVSETAAGLADSRLTLNLNEPNRLGDVSWAKPAKYVGIWWEMHLNRSTWGSGPKHGATTANTKRYIDFAAKYGFDGVLVEGWNTGWDGDWIANGAGFSFTKSYPDFDLAEVTSYARSKGVSLIGHNETAGAIQNYESQMEAGFRQYAKYGVHSIKTGYVKPNGTIQRITPDGAAHNEWFAGQYLVRHHQLVAETAARYRIAIDAHEPVKDTGLRRTWPNLMSREGARGQEFNAWGDPTNPPEHVVILPLTRLLAGPMDFTPGIFDITEGGKPSVAKRVQSTLANQLALYVVIYSPLHMAADLPENYEKHLDAFQFIRDVPTDWERSRTLDAKIGDYIVVARQERGGRDWYLGALTDEQARTLTVSLDFLDPQARYEAQIYRDGANADYRTRPVAYQIERRSARAGDRLTLKLAPGGGTAIRFRALQ